MKLKMVSIRDDKIGAYMNPQFFRSTGEAERSFTSLVNDPQSQVANYPDDFCLFELGEFDDSTGELRQYDQARSLGLAAHFKVGTEAAAAAARSFGKQN